MQMRLTLQGQTFTVNIDDLTTRPIIATVDGQRFEVWPEPATAPVGAAVVPAPLAVSPPPVVASSPPLNSNSFSNSASVFAPLPGLIVSLSVAPGDTVKVGQELCAIEAMKMKNVIRAARPGQIARLAVSVGQVVKHREVLLQYAEG